MVFISRSGEQRCSDVCVVSTFSILQPPPASSPHLRILNGHLAITSPAQPAPRPQTTLTEIYKLKRHNFSFNLLFSVEHGPHVTRTLLWTNLASKYFGKYSKVKHTFLQTTYQPNIQKLGSNKNRQGSEHQAKQ